MANNIVQLVRRRKPRMSDLYGDGGWGGWSDDGFSELPRIKGLTGASLRVLLTIISHLDKGNYVQLRNVEIADWLGMRSSHVAHEVRALANAGVLLPYQQRGHKGWRLNPRYGFKGDPDPYVRPGPGGVPVFVD